MRWKLDDTLYVPIHDARGNVCVLLDASSSPSETIRYTAFGPVEAATLTPWQYSSKRFDSETGFFHFPRRYYSPDLGRWISPDPLDFEDGLNLYSYVHNQPLTHIDPDGQFAFLISLAISYAVSAVIDYALPMAVAYAEQNAGPAAAALISGLANGYNFANAVYYAEHPDSNLAMIEKGSMLLGGFFGLISGNGTRKGARDLAACQMTSVMATQAGKKLVTPMYTKTGRESAKGVVATTATQFEKSMLKTGNVAKEIDVFGKVTNHNAKFISRGAENVNAGAYLNNKLSLLESFPKNSDRVRVFSDSKIRYYTPEVFARTPGPTRGACNVLEWNLNTNKTRAWYECYDHFGNVNRVHPKNINGQKLISPHYPPTVKDLM